MIKLESNFVSKGNSMKFPNDSSSVLSGRKYLDKQRLVMKNTIVETCRTKTAILYVFGLEINSKNSTIFVIRS